MLKSLRKWIVSGKEAAIIVTMMSLAAVGEAFSAVGPKWISGGTDAPEKPAPVLVRQFSLDATPTNAVFTVAVAGWCEVSVNGKRVGRDVLSPVTCQPDKRTSSLDFDVAPFLKVGDNTLEVLLGNGWQNAFTVDAWGFASAPWVSCPKICGKLNCDGLTLFATDDKWHAYDSPIVFNALRNGEWYDARLEGRHANRRQAKVEKYAPWGVVSAEDAVPCREGELFEPKKILKTPQGEDVYDFGANIAGWCEIEVKGAAGAKVLIDYDESLADDNTPLGHVVSLTKGRGEKRPVQHDEYTLSGRLDGERWHPRFAYHGFRYAKVRLDGDVCLKSLRARFVHSDFARAGLLETSDATFAALQSATERSYLSNFVGIPTDCPHREKNGWTGDAQLAMETGLWNYDAKASYVHFLRMILDAQRPNGAVPCIVPCSPKFGFFWGSGPAWDAILFEIPWQIYRFYGDDAPAREAYPSMKRYIAFIEEKVDNDGLYDYGLGDWCAPKGLKKPSTRLSDSAYVYEFNRRMAFWAERFEEREYAAERNAAAERIKSAFSRVFYKGDGLYEDGQLTSLAAPLYFKGLCVDGEEAKVIERLVTSLRENGHRALFGILGAKWIPRVLADYGYADDAFRMFVQPEMPGWAHWLDLGGGTLMEHWDGTGSRNHIMFGDLSAWAYEYAAGIVPLAPGFKKVAIRPNFLDGVDSFSATHRTPYGDIRVFWCRKGGKPKVEYSVPDGVEVVKEAAESSPGEKPLRVLMIGNSFSLSNIRQMPQIAASMGLSLDLASLHIGGCSLERHWNNVLAASTNATFRPCSFNRNRSGKTVRAVSPTSIPEALALEKWDVVTIQQSSSLSWRAESYEPFGGLLVAKIRELAPQAKIIVQETWSYPPWDKRLEKFGFGQDEMYRRLHGAYAAFAKKYGFDVIPVGTVAENISDRDSLFTEPDFHFNRNGEYLQGLVWTAKLFGVDVRTCQYVPDGMSQARAKEIQSVVMDVVATKVEVPDAAKRD